MTVNLFRLKQHEIAQWWPKIENLANEAMKTTWGKFEGEDIFSHACLGKVQFWIGTDENQEVKLFGITQVNDFPNARICEVICVTGSEKEQWEDKMPIVEQWAAYNGCKVMELYARIGWERIMKKHGYEKTHVILNKKIGE